MIPVEGTAGVRINVGIAATTERHVDTVEMYLELMKRCLTNTLYDAPDLVPLGPRSAIERLVVSAFRSWGITLARAKPADDRARGLDKNPNAHTMIGLERLGNIQSCVEQILQDGVPGDLIEVGVWRGGTAAFMRAILKAHGVFDRIVWLADSFEGLPAPDEERYPQDTGDLHHTSLWMAIPLEEVQETFRRYGLLDNQVRYLKGWFKDTLPHAPVDRLAVAHLDGDMYESTMESLVNLYPKLSPGSFIILDDWGLIPSCRRAIEDYRTANNITEPIRPIDGVAVYWRRER